MMTHADVEGLSKKLLRVSVVVVGGAIKRGSQSQAAATFYCLCVACKSCRELRRQSDRQIRSDQIRSGQVGSADCGDARVAEADRLGAREQRRNVRPLAVVAD